jgi:hypothetical protein
MRFGGTGVAVAIALVTAPVAADPPAPLIVTSGMERVVRVLVAEGPRAMPCDASPNHVLFDGKLAPGETWYGATNGDCICVQHTSASFERSDWSSPGLACRPRVCRGKSCRPAPDPTIRLRLPLH